MLASGSLVLAALCLTGAVSDIRTRRLPNWLAGLALLSGLTFAALSGGFAAMLSPFAHAILALLGGMVLFRIGFIGAGDAKFYAGLAAWFALSGAPLLLMCVALAGLVLLIAMLMLSHLRRLNRADRRRAMSELPYGVAIAAGAMAGWVLQTGIAAG